MPSPFPTEDVAVPCDETSAMFGVWTPQPVDIRQCRRVVLIALLLLAALLALTHGAPGTWKMLVVTIGLGLALMTLSRSSA